MQTVPIIQGFFHRMPYCLILMVLETAPSPEVLFAGFLVLLCGLSAKKLPGGGGQQKIALLASSRERGQRKKDQK